MKAVKIKVLELLTHIDQTGKYSSIELPSKSSQHYLYSAFCNANQQSKIKSTPYNMFVCLFFLNTIPASMAIFMARQFLIFSSPNLFVFGQWEETGVHLIYSTFILRNQHSSVAKSINGAV